MSSNDIKVKSTDVVGSGAHPTKKIVIGFTGTRTGMTDQQKEVVRKCLKHFLSAKTIELEHVIHGDCIGADAQFSAIATALHVPVWVRPSNIEDTRAHSPNIAVTYPPEAPLDRDKKIVSDAHIMIATPKQFKPLMRSGTWTTIRYTIKASKGGCLKPLIVIYPDGTVTVNNASSMWSLISAIALNNLKKGEMS